MTRHLGVLLDWTMVDFVVLGIAIQQYISISRDLKRTRENEKMKNNTSSEEKGEPPAEAKRLL